MGRIDARLEALGIALPAPLVMPGANRSPAVQVGDVLYVSGHGAALLDDDSVVRRGKVDIDVTIEQAQATMRALALKMLATVRHHTGDLDRVQKVVKILGMVNTHPDFEKPNVVLNGASDVFYDVFGPQVGQHARSSLGVATLAERQPAEIEGIFLIRQ